jgi:hypothetical protein
MSAFSSATLWERSGCGSQFEGYSLPSSRRDSHWLIFSIFSVHYILFSAFAAYTICYIFSMHFIFSLCFILYVQHASYAIYLACTTYTIMSAFSSATLWERSERRCIKSPTTCFYLTSLSIKGSEYIHREGECMLGWLIFVCLFVERSRDMFRVLPFLHPFYLLISLS